MAYEPTTWNCGDTITAEKLNKLENGLAECCGGGTEPLVVGVTISEGDSNTIHTLDKTFAEIKNAFPNVIISHEWELDGTSINTSASIDAVSVTDFGDEVTRMVSISELKATILFDNMDIVAFETDSDSGYPAHAGTK